MDSSENIDKLSTPGIGPEQVVAGRPRSITIISWIVIVTGGLSLVMSFVTGDNPQALAIMELNPIPILVQQAMTYLGALISVVSGIVMLRGGNWGRWLYVIWSAFGFVVGFMTSPIKTVLVPSLVLLLIAVVFLFLPKANAFFAHAEVGDDS